VLLRVVLLLKFENDHIKYNTQTTNLETHIHIGCLPATDNSDSEFALNTFMSCLPDSNDDSMYEFYTSYGYLLLLPSQEDGHLPRGTHVMLTLVLYLPSSGKPI
jgi:hypothetical protein